MVNHVDLQQLPGANEVARHLDVGLGGSRVAGGVVVHEYHRCGAADDRYTEYLARMNEDRVQGADGHKLVPFHPAAGVEENDHKTLGLGVEVGIGGDVQPPVIGGLIGRLANEHGLRHWTIPQGNDLEFFRVEVSHVRPRFPRTSGRG